MTELDESQVAAGLPAQGPRPPAVASPRRWFPLKCLITALLAVGIVALGVSRQFYTEALVDAFFGLALASVIIIHLRLRPRWTDVVMIAAGAALLGLVDFGLLHYPPRIMAWFSFLGLSSFFILSVYGIWGANRRFFLCAWAPAALFVVSDYFADLMLAWTSKVHPRTLDLYLLSFDASLGTLLPFDVGRYYAQVAWLHICALIAYIGLALPIAMVYAGWLVRIREKALPVMSAFLIVGPAGILLYNCFPACGPRPLFGSAFPFQPVAIADMARLVLEPAAIQGPRNAIPSLHLAWTLLAWWYSRGLSRPERSLAFAFLAFTVVATLGTGEHWFIDLVVAFPYALTIQALCSQGASWTSRGRRSALAAGVLGTAAWLLALRFAPHLFWLSPAVPWTLCAATVGLTCWLQSNMVKATKA